MAESLPSTSFLAFTGGGSGLADDEREWAAFLELRWGLGLGERLRFLGGGDGEGLRRLAGLGLSSGWGREVFLTGEGERSSDEEDRLCAFSARLSPGGLCHLPAGWGCRGLESLSSGLGLRWRT